MFRHLLDRASRLVRRPCRPAATLSHWSALNVEPLEDRRLLAVTATWSSSFETLTIEIDDTGDAFEVSVDGSNNVTVTDVSGAPTSVTISPSAPASSAVEHLIIHGGDGNDSIDLTDVTAANGFESGMGIIVDGGAGDDTFEGSEFADVISGGAGDDTLNGNAGNDVLSGNDGDDELNGGAGADLLSGGANDTGSDELNGDAGNDRLQGDGFTGGTNLGNRVDPTGAANNEASGLVVGRTNADILWTVEDSGNDKRLIANELDGDSRGYYTLTIPDDFAGAYDPDDYDWEDMAFYYDSSTDTDWIYIAQIGDNPNSNNGQGEMHNDDNNSTIRIYRIEEPTLPGSGTGEHAVIDDADIERILLTYPDDGQGGTNRGRDAETFMVDPLTGDMYIVTKREPTENQPYVYSLTASAAASSWTAADDDAPAPLEVTNEGALNLNLPAPAGGSNDAPSSGDISPDGTEVLLKSDFAVYRYDRVSPYWPSIADLLTDYMPTEMVRGDEPGTDREAIAWDPSGTEFYTVEEDEGQIILYEITGAGADILYGGDDHDHLYGGDDGDTLDGGAGFDNIYGGDGNDLAYGGSGEDFIEGGDGSDTIYGGDDSDYAYGGPGNDYIYGENGNDSLMGEDGNDILYAGTGDDWVYGADGDDYLGGQDGNDFLEGGTGNDQLVGGDGDDRYWFSGTSDLGTDRIVEFEDADVDELDFTYFGFPVTVDLTLTGNQNQTVAVDGMNTMLVLNLYLSDVSISNVTGSAYADDITGNSLDNVIVGGAGNDEIDGGSGDDTLYGGVGDDNIYGGSGTDTGIGGDGTDTPDGDVEDWTQGGANQP